MTRSEAGQRDETDVAASAESLFAHYRLPLVRYFARRGHPPDVAEDCAQDVFVRISRADLGAVQNIEAYLFAVASSVAIDHVRKSRVRQSLRHDPLNNLELESMEASPSRVLEGKEAIILLGNILNELKPRTREIFLLNRLDGLSYTQLAARFGVSVAAIEKQMSKALAHIRRRFGND